MYSFCKFLESEIIDNNTSSELQMRSLFVFCMLMASYGSGSSSHSTTVLVEIKEIPPRPLFSSICRLVNRLSEQ